MAVFVNWRFDPRSALVTIVLLPLLFFLLKIILKYLKRWGAYILEGAMYWVSRLIMHSFAGALTLKRYCRLQLANKNQYLHIPSSQDIRLDIDKVYVTLTLNNNTGEKKSYNHHDLLQAGTRLRIIGDPGSGKSSLIKRLFRDSCLEGIEAPRKAHLPVLIELKNLDVPNARKNLGDWFYKALKTEAQKTAVYRMDECFDTYARTGGLLVLLDGLDEVSTKQYPRVRQAIEGLSSELSRFSDRNIVVLTMRTQFYQQIRESFRDSFPQVMSLRPFTSSDIYEFLTRWPFKTKVEANISRVYRDLSDRPTLREMCSNPLVLSMYVAEDQAAGHLVAPDTRTEFYSKVIEELIIRRRLQQTGATKATSKLREQRQRILGQLAYEHLLNPEQPANLLAWNDALRVTAGIMNCSESRAETIFRETAKETGVVTEERPGQTFRFIHLTVCEFLASYESVQGQESGWDSLINAHIAFHNSDQPQLRTRLTEVIPFAAGLLPRIKRDPALAQVRDLNDRRLLSLTFLETKLYDSAIWPSFVATEKESLLNTPEADWDDRWLRRLHLFNVVVNDANEGSAHVPIQGGTTNLQEFFRSLVERQQGSLFTLLSAFAAQDAAAAFRLANVLQVDLAQDFPELIIKNCDQIPFFALVKDQLLQDLSRAELWACLLCEAGLRSRAVAELLAESPPVFELERIVKTLPKSQMWTRYRTLKPSLYAQLLPIATGSKVKESTPFQLLHCVAQLPTPNSVPLISLPLAGFTILTLSMYFILEFYLAPRILQTALPLGLLPLYALFWALGRRSLRIRLTYRDALQVGAPSGELLGETSQSERRRLVAFLLGVTTERYLGKKPDLILRRLQQLRSAIATSSDDHRGTEALS